MLLLLWIYHLLIQKKCIIYQKCLKFAFNDCQNLTSLDLNNFGTSRVANMNRIFYNCQSLNLSSFNTEKVHGMSRMFWNCSNLLLLDLPNFNSKNAFVYGDKFKAHIIIWLS